MKDLRIKDKWRKHNISGVCHYFPTLQPYSHGHETACQKWTDIGNFEKISGKINAPCSTCYNYVNLYFPNDQIFEKKGGEIT